MEAEDYTIESITSDSDWSSTFHWEALSVARSSQKSYFFPQHNTNDIPICSLGRVRFTMFRSATVFRKTFSKL